MKTIIFTGLLSLIAIGCNDADIMSSSTNSSAALPSSSSNNIVVGIDTCYKEFKSDTLVAVGFCTLYNGKLAVTLFDSDIIESQPKATTKGTEGLFYRKSITLKSTWQSVKWTLSEVQGSEE